ncbi:hypothetical protein HF086_003566 [Spodoptera exigua]|uniref:FP protein C-terminal domain-containing protein n=1 Tax=Spodoptera exigua TaxID=7107 RepID=A0A922SIP6_SPOEX|nr:hypothetical protein HF086_003566 [Spodoptera exigua]
MSRRGTPPAPPSPIGHTQSETDLNSLQQSDVSFITSRNKRPRTDESSPGQHEQDLKREIMGLLSNWKLELESKLDDMCAKHNNLVSKLSTEILELKTQTSKIQECNDKIETSMNFINKQYEEIKVGLDNMKKERQEQRKCLENLENKVQDLALKSRSSCIEVRNIPLKDKETSVDLADTVCKIGKTVGIAISPTDLRDVYRLPGKHGSIRPIVAEFHTVQMKLSTLSSVRNFNNNKRTVEEKLNTELINIAGKRQAVYVADYLPASSRKLFHMSREYAKQNNFEYCWTSNGNIFLRKKQGDKQILVSSEQCLLDLGKNV